MSEQADCTNCRFTTKEQLVDERQNAIVGQFQYTCRRFPPSAFAIPHQHGFKLASAFPVVSEGMVCSLHQSPDTDGAMQSDNVPGTLLT